VLALERASAGGGTSANSGGLIYLGGGTPVQKAAGFDDSPEEMYRFLCAISQPGPNEERIRYFCEHSVEHFHWLEAQGLPFKRSFYPEPGLESRTDDCLVYSGGEDASPWKDLARPAPRGHKPQTQGKAGPFLMQRRLAALAAKPVQVETDVRAEKLVASVAYYNEHAAEGQDPLSGKRREMLVSLRDAPFALVDCTLENARYASFTIGGLHTGANSEVLDATGRAVPGLYAAGRSSALFCGQGYPGSGISLADASFHGRVAARAALRTDKSSG
jgi:succinate dehydrogenase/fumarate reductase flavoprotein subunit